MLLLIARIAGPIVVVGLAAFIGYSKGRIDGYTKAAKDLNEDLDEKFNELGSKLNEADYQEIAELRAELAELEITEDTETARLDLTNEINKL